VLPFFRQSALASMALPPPNQHLETFGRSDFGRHNEPILFETVLQLAKRLPRELSGKDAHIKLMLLIDEEASKNPDFREAFGRPWDRMLTNF
jgi:hypothetical protein